MNVLQELKGETWVFEANSMIFHNSQLIGGPTEFIQWAETNYNYEMFRPLTLYQTLAEQQYKDHMNQNQVRLRSNKQDQLVGGADTQTHAYNSGYIVQYASPLYSVDRQAFYSLISEGTLLHGCIN